MHDIESIVMIKLKTENKYNIYILLSYKRVCV
jgi:hypothetical protein